MNVESIGATDRPLELAPGIRLWREVLARREQVDLVDEIFRLAEDAPFYRPSMPLSGRTFSVEETNFGSLGWYSDKNGYRYERTHPYTDRAWPAIPEALCALWSKLADYPAPAECCLVNLYRGGAKMGLHQDRDEVALDAPVLSVSLGDTAIFRFGGTERRVPSRTTKLVSGDVVVFGGPARLAFHGIDRVLYGSSTLIPDGGRLNLTMRRVNSR